MLNCLCLYIYIVQYCQNYHWRKHFICVNKIHLNCISNIFSSKKKENHIWLCLAKTKTNANLGDRSSLRWLLTCSCLAGRIVRLTIKLNMLTPKHELGLNTRRAVSTACFFFAGFYKYTILLKYAPLPLYGLELEWTHRVSYKIRLPFAVMNFNSSGRPFHMV